MRCLRAQGFAWRTLLARRLRRADDLLYAASVGAGLQLPAVACQLLLHGEPLSDEPAQIPKNPISR